MVRAAIRFVLLLVVALAGNSAVGSGFTNLISIDFEALEGYTNGRPLIGQSHWFVPDTNGSGVAAILSGLGQQGFVGINPPSPPGSFVSAAYPLFFTPTNYSYLSFSTVLNITSSTHGGEDNFRWFFLSPDQVDLLEVDFYNGINLVVCETNDGNDFLIAGTFTNAQLFRLEIDMDFIHNTWTAYLGTNSITPAPLPIGIPGHPIAFQGMVIYWVYQNSASPGNNAMYFDHVRAVAGTAPPTIPAPQLQVLPNPGSPGVSISVTTEPGLNYILESSTDLLHWAGSLTNYATNLLWNISNSIPPGSAGRYYRAYAVAP